MSAALPLRRKFFPNGLVGEWSSAESSFTVRRIADTVVVEFKRHHTASIRLRVDQALRLSQFLNEAATTEPLGDPDVDPLTGETAE